MDSPTFEEFDDGNLKDGIQRLAKLGTLNARSFVSSSKFLNDGSLGAQNIAQEASAFSVLFLKLAYFMSGRYFLAH